MERLVLFAEICVAVLRFVMNYGHGKIPLYSISLTYKLCGNPIVRYIVPVVPYQKYMLQFAFSVQAIAKAGA